MSQTYICIDENGGLVCCATGMVQDSAGMTAVLEEALKMH